MIPAAAFLAGLKARGFGFFTGVPCSFLKPLINAIIGDPSLRYVGATSEGEAVGIAMGAHLGGAKTVLLCQNSGLGNMVNPLVSLNHPFKIPTLLITTWRGQPGIKDEPQHDLMGRITHALLDTLQIPWLAFPREEGCIAAALDAADEHMQRASLPFALVMSQDSVEECPLSGVAAAALETTSVRERVGSRMIRTEAIQAVLEGSAPSDAIIATTGKTGRELFTVADRPGHLYVVGGMGTASAIGLGVALCRPSQSVIVLDGDGAALMKMGNLATIGHHSPRNLIHVVLDNESHDSTGGQKTVSGTVRFSQAAAACNYRNAWAYEAASDVAGAIRELRSRPGPSLLHIRIRPGSPGKLGRPTIAPADVKRRFMDFLASAPADCGV